MFFAAILATRQVAISIHACRERANMIYYWISHSNTMLGSKAVGVRCEKCATHYGYVLVRRVRGEASSPYGLLSFATAIAARRRAEEGLREELEAGIDPTQCPNCNHLQSDMVEEARMRNSRFWSLSATPQRILLGGLLLGVAFMVAIMANAPLPVCLVVVVLGFGVLLSAPLFRPFIARSFDPNALTPEQKRARGYFLGTREEDWDEMMEKHRQEILDLGLEGTLAPHPFPNSRPSGEKHRVPYGFDPIDQDFPAGPGRVLFAKLVGHFSREPAWISCHRYPANDQIWFQGLDRLEEYDHAILAVDSNEGWAIINTGDEYRQVDLHDNQALRQWRNKFYGISEGMWVPRKRLLYVAHYPSPVRNSAGQIESSRAGRLDCYRLDLLPGHQPATETTAAAVDGFMFLVCDKCNKKLKVSTALAGKVVKCPGCGNRVRAPCSSPE